MINKIRISREISFHNGPIENSNIKNRIKSSLEKFDSRSEEAEKRISKYEEKTVEMIKLEEQRIKELRKWKRAKRLVGYHQAEKKYI